MSKRTVAIVTDSTCDLDAALAKAQNITVVPLNVHFGESVYLDQIDITTDEFMEKMGTTTQLPTTSQPSVGMFEEAFKRAAAEQGVSEIVCISISSKLSGTFQSASIASQNLADELSIEVVDSFSGSYGLGFQVLRAAELADEGKNAKQISEILLDELGRYHIVFFVDTLDHLRRGGRIGKAAQLVGTFLQLKPLLRIDEGQIVPFERTRTRSKAVRALEAFAADSGPAEELTVLYNTTPDEAKALARSISVHTPGKDPVVAKVSPVIAAHIGPDIMGVVIKERLGD